MRKGEAARTAQTVAFARAIETRRDARERVYDFAPKTVRKANGAAR